MNKIIFFIFFISFLLIFSVSAKVIISEVMYDLNGSDDNREWIEIYSGEEVNLSGWKFYEAKTNHRLNLTKGSESFSGYAVIANNAGKFLEDNPDFDGNLFDSTFSLANTNETIALKDASLNIIDEITYFSSSGGNGNGRSLQLVDDEWCEGIPTPEESNECYVEEIPPETPKNDSLDGNITADNNSLGNDTTNTSITQNNSSSTATNSTSNKSSQTSTSKTSGTSSKTSSSITGSAVSNSTENISTGAEGKKVIYQAKADKMRKTALYLAIGLFIVLIIYILKSNNF
jgi:hypothetical protein